MKVRAFVAGLALAGLVAWIVVASRVSDLLIAHTTMVWSGVIRGICSAMVCATVAVALFPLWRGAEYIAQAGSVGAGSLMRAVTLLGFTILTLYGVLEIGRSASSTFMSLLPPTDDLTQGTFKWEPEDARLSYEGLITVSFPERLRSQLSAHGDAKELAIKSDGGFVDAARAGALVLNARGAGISVAEGCYSACAVLFAVADRRFTQTEAEVGFHAPYKRDASGIFRYSQSIGGLRSLFLDAGFPETFVAESFGTKATEMKGIKGKELIELTIAMPLSESPSFNDRLVRNLAGVRAAFKAYPKIAAGYDKGSSLVAALQASDIAKRDGARISDHLQRLDWVAQSGFLFTDSAAAADLSDKFTRAALHFIFELPPESDDLDQFALGQIKRIEDLALAQIRIHSPAIVQSLDYATDEELDQLFSYIVGNPWGAITEKNYTCRHIVLGGVYDGYFREAAHTYFRMIQQKNPDREFDAIEGVLSFAKSIGQGYRLGLKVVARGRPSGRSDKWPAGKEPQAMIEARLDWAKRVNCFKVDRELNYSLFRSNPEYRYLYLRTFFDDSRQKRES